ncbi:hypothetical protein PLICRDRAFT_46637 [Plicaturopsis crispa FD-325 SS-3]|uniref:Uncharacterized protein n=1 Tax=Plicaturopsis crispa FD-325 SS-3 TaxID=944288 RepID=A0A0C9SKK2_PLICR|nr:hypothetical protein PLICRDRAFT_46637 [Plicaturopsis crispa FD-325 SS-3]
MTVATAVRRATALQPQRSATGPLSKNTTKSHQRWCRALPASCALHSTDKTTCPPRLNAGYAARHLHSTPSASLKTVVYASIAPFAMRDAQCFNRRRHRYESIRST